MKLFPHHASFLIFTAILSGCASYEFSNKSKHELTEMTVVSYENPLTLMEVIDKNSDGKSRGLITTDVLIEGANLAIQGVKMVIDKSQEKYNQQYISGLRNARFYGSNSKAGMMDPDQIVFKGFEVSRTFVNPSDQREMAVFARFVMDENKLEDIYFNSKFYLKLDSFSLEYSKVKINQSKWYLPWTWFLKNERKIQLDFEIDIKANWLDKNGEIHRDVSFGHFALPLRNIPIDPDDATRGAYFAELKGLELQGASYIIPRSATYCTNEVGELELCYGRGDFNVELTAVESSKSDFVTQKLSENSDAIFEVLKGKDIINALQKKKE